MASYARLASAPTTLAAREHRALYIPLPRGPVKLFKKPPCEQRTPNTAPQGTEQKLSECARRAIAKKLQDDLMLTYQLK